MAKLPIVRIFSAGYLEIFVHLDRTRYTMHNSKSSRRANCRRSDSEDGVHWPVGLISNELNHANEDLSVLDPLLKKSLTQPASLKQSTGLSHA